MNTGAKLYQDVDGTQGRNNDIGFQGPEGVQGTMGENGVNGTQERPGLAFQGLIDRLEGMMAFQDFGEFQYHRVTTVCRDPKGVVKEYLDRQVEKELQAHRECWDRKVKKEFQDHRECLDHKVSGGRFGPQGDEGISKSQGMFEPQGGQQGSEGMVGHQGGEGP